MKDKINLVLCWHMHQPWYREGLQGTYRLPWVYLHVIKDYADMAAHLERHPNMHVVVNFAPVLLEQIDDYSQMLGDFLDHGKPMLDPMLNLLAGVEPIPQDNKVRQQLIMDCRRAHAHLMIKPHTAYCELFSMVMDGDPCSDIDVELDRLPYLQDQYFYDLITWFHLAWLGYSLKRTDTARTLVNKARCFTLEDRLQLIKLIHQCHVDLLDRYRKLADRGQIELSMTPYSHPIVPLLNSFHNMDCCQPEAPKPEHPGYPGGGQRSDWHMRHGIEVFNRHFGRLPKGVWFSEGGVSDDAIELLRKYDLKWSASGEGVWHNSCKLSGCDEKELRHKRFLFRPFQIENSDCSLFFRDDGLSDLIGFEYNKWNADDAVADFINHVTNIADFFGDKAHEHVVTVILDGENAWEHYSDNAWHFLDKLYAGLSKNPQINTTDFSSARSIASAGKMKKLCPGSWVYGTFSTWIGDPDKNRAWDLLIEAKQVWDEVMAAGKLDDEVRQQATLQLAVCEGSDWFWWFGDYNSSASVRDFDQLYRFQLAELYRLLGVDVPATLSTPISSGVDHAESVGTMRRSHT